MNENKITTYADRQYDDPCIRIRVMNEDKTRTDDDPYIRIRVMSEDNEDPI